MLKKILNKVSVVSFLLIFGTSTFAGNLPRLIALGQNATHENVIKFNKQPKFKDPKNPLNLNLSGRYVLAPSENGGYKTKSGNLATEFEYLLYDGGVNRAKEQTKIHQNISKLYKRDEILNQTALEIGRIYFEAIGIDEKVKLISEIIKTLEPLLEDATFWAEYGEIDSDELGLLQDTFERFLRRSDELGFRRHELLARINLLANGELDFIAGSKFARPDFSLTNGVQSEANLQLGLAKSYSAVEEQGKLMPKLYLKDTQNFDLSGMKFDKRSGKELISGYLAANRPMVEFSWKLPGTGSNKERQLRRIEEQKSMQAINEESTLSMQRLSELRERILALEARIVIDESKHARARDEIVNAARRYLRDDMDVGIFTAFVGSIFDESVKFIQNVSELEVSKMRWYFERGEKIEDKIL